MFKTSVAALQIDGPCTARVVKYIAKSAAKNMSSLDSHTMVPTATKFGRVILCELAMPVLVMRVSIPENGLKGLFVDQSNPLNS
jgi:hypothetical protein